ncbi:MerR family transcriptional regulator [Rhodoplanes serenus]|uniref:MerR family transcriptional regulator n=1 Tax=Rhodoplanes serenus TaxID=200615 RepID=A0A9X4XP13_9BRAD|nr:MerR family transcriptional regulator [Rhodoplanes serenus]MTW18660.1 MerR family transcriptional regulator [Rhodoplanes serenus]
MTRTFSIAEAASITGLSAHTLRYYEQIGLIDPVARRGGVRRYDDDDLRWLQFLVRLRATRMSMREMKRYAQLRRAGAVPDGVTERKTMLERHAATLETDISLLGETLVLIREKIATYETLERSIRRADGVAPIHPRPISGEHGEGDVHEDACARSRRSAGVGHRSRLHGNERLLRRSRRR